MFEFELLQREDIETLRAWRNHRHNSQWFEYQKQISKGDQILWYEQLDSTKDQYYTLKKNGKISAFFHLRHSAEHNKTAECGLITNPKDAIGNGSLLPGSLYLMEIAFEELQLDKLFAKVKQTNELAIRYNLDLGFTTLPLKQSNDFCWMVLTLETYHEKKKKLTELCLLVR